MTEDTQNGSRKKRSRSKDDTSLRYIEFYVGIGGWTMAVERVTATMNHTTLSTECVAAWDVSDLCASVYEHNFSNKVNKSSIETLTRQQLEAYNANVWLLSPPCQPHTRQHHSKTAQHRQSDLDDPRSHSFVHLCQLLREMSQPPNLIVLENVVGFAASQSCALFRQVLHDKRYQVAHFHLQPTQVGLPNDRPRYYCVAVLSAQYCCCPNNNNNNNNTSSHPEWIHRYIGGGAAANHDGLPHIHTSLPELGVPAVAPPLPPLSHFLDPPTSEYDQKLDVPPNCLDRSAAWCFDIVHPNCRRSACFTSGYGRFIRGTGSVLLCASSSLSSSSDTTATTTTPPPQFALERPEERQYDPNWKAALQDSGYKLRYFSGSELARLFGFSESFGFPENMSIRQQHKLMGNSLNVWVAAKLVDFGLCAMQAGERQQEQQQQQEK